MFDFVNLCFDWNCVMPTRFLLRLLALVLLLRPFSALTANEAPLRPLRIGVLEFGTVNWELALIQTRELAKKRGIDLQVLPLASADASTVALQGGAVDMIVSDWIWVTRQRAASNLYTFAPYSNAVGSVMVKADSGIHQLADLKDKKLGIAGGPTDKTWLLLRAYAQRKLGVDLTQFTQPSYAAPPLLNELMLRGQVDAALNVWHYAARLEGAGMKPLIEVPEMLKGLGVEKPIPLIGWVFREDWASANSAVVKGFLAASYEAKAILASSDASWELLRPKMRAENEMVFKALRTGYRAGIPVCADQDTLAAVTATFKVLAETGGEKLVGKSKSLTSGTFWPGFSLPPCTTR
jgi:NitT/TauT family transport system substrate-binding protein